METGSVGIKNRTETQSIVEKTDLHQNLQDRFNESFAKVFNGGKPKISVDIFYSPHDTPEDMRGLSDQLKQTDVYIPEAFSWNRRVLSMLRDVSSGEIDPGKLSRRIRRNYSGVFRNSLEEIYDSKKAITLVDVRSDAKLRTESDGAWDYLPSLDGSFAEALNYTKTFVSNLSSYIARREDYILSQVTPRKIKELIEQYPWLRDKKEIKILLSLGSGHAPMPDDFSRTSFTDEAIIKSKLGEQISDDLASKVFLENFLDTILLGQFSTSRYWLTKDTKKIVRLKRIIIGQLNYQDAQRIFDYCKRMRVFPRDEMERMFSEKNIEIPGNEKELDGLFK